MPLAAYALTSLEDTVDFIDAAVPESDEPGVEQMINAASLTIIREAGREFAPPVNGASRTLDHRGGWLLSLDPYDARAITGITVDGAELAGESYRTRLDDNGVIVAIEFASTVWWDTSRFQSVPVTIVGDWGFPTVPADVKRACERMVDAWYAADGPPHAEEYLEAPAQPAGMVPFDVWGVIQSYRRLTV